MATYGITAYIIKGEFAHMFEISPYDFTFDCEFPEFDLKEATEKAERELGFENYIDGFEKIETEVFRVVKDGKIWFEQKHVTRTWEPWEPYNGSKVWKI